MFNVSCQGQDRVADHNLYFEAATAAKDGATRESWRLCAQIRAPNLSDECQFFTARTEIVSGVQGEDACQQIVSLEWKEACVFEAVDAAELMGPQAEEACERTGRFAQRCLLHVLQREVDALATKSSIGEEATLLADVTSAIELRRGTVQHLESETYVAGVIAGRMDDEFDPLRCGAADLALCELSLKAWLVQTLRWHSTVNLEHCPMEWFAPGVEGPEWPSRCSEWLARSTEMEAVARLLGRWRMGPMKSGTGP